MRDFCHDLFDYARRVGPMYGVEDLAVLLYSVVRMHKPKLMIELGSGSGTCSLLCAQAMRENGIGKVVSVDNGSQWEKIRIREELSSLNLNIQSSHHEFLNDLADKYSVRQFIQYVEDTIPPFPNTDGLIDLLFIDYESGHGVIASILGHFLLKMSASSSIFIDGASTSWSSFLFIERMIADLNRAKIPAVLLQLSPDETFQDWMQLVHTRRFTLIHLTRQTDQQNSTAWIKIDPVDNRPYPTTKMR